MDGTLVPAALDSSLYIPELKSRRRESALAELVTQGLGNREIAEQLVLAKRTVDSHIEHIFNKLGFTSRAQIAAWVSRQDAS